MSAFGSYRITVDPRRCCEDEAACICPFNAADPDSANGGGANIFQANVGFGADANKLASRWRCPDMARSRLPTVNSSGRYLRFGASAPRGQAPQIDRTDDSDYFLQDSGRRKSSLTAEF